MPSEQDGAAQKPFWQERLEQSDPMAHLAPTLHRWHLPAPPQSTSTSTPLRTPSEHVAAMHVLFVALHTPDRQSEAREHPLPTPQGEHKSPPPSTHVSCPFLTPSEHVACGTHTPATHVPEWQSSPASHRCPTRQGPHWPAAGAVAAVPQSTSVSATGFRMPSKQVGAWHTPLEHAPNVLQSDADLQGSPKLQAFCPAKRSTHTSSPLRTASVEVGGAQIPALEGDTATFGSRDMHTREMHCLDRRHRPKFWMLMVELSVKRPVPASPVASDGRWHAPPKHTSPEAQSVLSTQCLVRAHGGHEPPQSTSDS
jgi:hypothetical protein